MRLWWVLVTAVAVTACVSSNLVQCEDGLACPSSDVCDEIHHGCVAPDQLTACDGLADNSACVAGDVTGSCYDGVCLPHGCGNGIVEPGEQCDDGNQVSNDGCSADCKSNETCGNGVVDEDRGEQCDDGNHLAHDGCDSTCQSEATTWTIVAVEPATINRDSSAYDIARGRLVDLVAGTTWEWDGTRWTTDAGTVPIGSALYYKLFYDPVTAHVERFDVDASGMAKLLSWDGAAWTAFSQAQIAITQSSVVFAVTAMFDVANDRALLFVNVDDQGTSATLTYAVDASGTWTTIAGPDLSAEADLAAAYDVSTGEAIVMEGHYDVGTGANVVEWSSTGGAWTPNEVYQMPIRDWSVTYDDARGHLILLDTRENALWERLASWTPITGTTPVTTAGPPGLAYDASSDALSVFPSATSAIWTWSGGAWATSIGPAPYTVGMLAALPALPGFVVLGGDAVHDHTWTWDGAWHASSASGPPARTGEVATYDPTNRATVLAGGNNGSDLLDAWSFDGAGWTELAAPPPQSPIYAIGYDPSGRDVVAEWQSQMSFPQVYDLSSADGSWQSAGFGPKPDGPTDLIVDSIVWDARNANVVNLAADGTLYDNTSNGWHKSLSVGSTGSVAIADERRGSIIVLLGDGTGQVWERSGGQWTQLDSLPIAVAGAIAYDPVQGRVFVLGASQSVGTLLLVRTTTSSAPDETCAPGVDADGDGLAGCDDPDCYWACGGCPPYTTCP